MVDRVQAKSKAVETSVFHSGLIKMIVMEELRKKNIDWEEFITSSHFQFPPSREREKVYLSKIPLKL
jgi:hypothetical protein